jgi:V8-like Glu-specific endopeptidase
MEKITRRQLNEMVEKYGDAVPGLKKKLEENICKEYEIIDPVNNDFEKITTAEVPESPTREADELPPVHAERIIIATAGARPVVKILNNQVTDQFLGKNTEGSPWGPILIEAAAMINKSIPAIGRIELKNGEIPWCGTGWLIDDGIIVTNAHVADIFAKLDDGQSQFIFKPGLVRDQMSSGIDFLKEEGNDTLNEHPITDILYVAPAGEADVAFLRVKQGSENRPLPAPIVLASDIKDDATIVAIGYPARDPSIRDQNLVISIFGNDVYDRKRLSPGKVKVVSEQRLHHDCSTLGGNSGSVLIEISSGKAIGLHQGGFLDDSTNVGVTIQHVKKMLEKVKANLTKPGNAESNNKSKTDMNMNNNNGEIKLTLNIPLEITIKIGTTGSGDAGLQILAASASTNTGNIDEALKMAKTLIDSRQDKNFINVRKGYRFKNGWVTDEKVIVVEVKEKLPFNEFVGTNRKPLPREINGIGIDIRTAAMPDVLDEMGIDLVVLERKAKAAGYTEPPGFDDENSGFFLKRIRERMDAIFHVSPDAGFQHLSAFIGRTRKKITATMYEWEVNHVSDAIEAAMQGDGITLKMLTQRTGVAERDATMEAVADMQARLGNKFEHEWASTRGEQRLIPNSYHIKVASRDGEELWLSSGNWKSSNQPENPGSFQDLLDFNREWHAIVKNEKLAKLFQRYIDYDFAQAQLFPTFIKPVEESLELFVPDTRVIKERIIGATYDDTLRLENEMLDIQPLLTPDLDSSGGRIFMNHLIAMVKRATRKLYIQNQSFSYTEDNNAEFDELFEEIKKKQRSIDDVRLIIRDARDFGRPKDIENQQKLLERLKDHGLDTSARSLRLQSRCHNKGVIVDSSEVMLGSQNLTNGGSLVNRDASLLVRNKKVAEFYEKIFLFDWNNLAHNQSNESVESLRVARPGEPKPEGFRRVTLRELIGERE